MAFLNQETIPIFLQVNPDLINGLFDLKYLGIEIISEEEDGYIIGASIDGLRRLEEKINGFARETFGSAKIADLWQIISGNREDWKPKHILSDELLAKWSFIDDNALY